ncbi:hypothetical protein [Novosphingobium aquae]|uniref:Uncharacterized protein n=1 Tax=Novosphingobium aquae TaxID=3133435 RepID=A0ABU8SCX2_9SPHN
MPGLLPSRSAKGLEHTRTLLHAGWFVTKPAETQGDQFADDWHTLDTLGLDYLKEHRGLSPRAVKFYRPRGDYRGDFYHNLGVTEAIANIRAGLHQEEASFIPQEQIEWDFGKYDELPIAFPAKTSAVLKNGPVSWEGHIQPDAVFGVEYPGGGKNYFALEYQRAGPVRTNVLKGVSSMLKKYLAYADAHTSKTFKSEWGITGQKTPLYVLFVFTTEIDYRASLKLCSELFPNGAPMFFHAHIAPTRKTPGGFTKPAYPFPEIATMKWERVGCGPKAIYEKDPTEVGP